MLIICAAVDPSRSRAVPVTHGASLVPALNVTHGNMCLLPALVIEYPPVYMTLCTAVGLLSRKEKLLILALTYRALHAPNVSLEMV